MNLGFGAMNPFYISPEQVRAWHDKQAFLELLQPGWLIENHVARHTITWRHLPCGDVFEFSPMSVPTSPPACTCVRRAKSREAWRQHFGILAEIEETPPTSSDASHA